MSKSKSTSPTNSRDFKVYVDGMEDLLDAAAEMMDEYPSDAEGILAFMRGFVGAARNELRAHAE